MYLSIVYSLGLPNAVLTCPSLISIFFKETCRAFAKQLVAQQFPVIWLYEDCAHKQNGTVNME